MHAGAIPKHALPGLVPGIHASETGMAEPNESIDGRDESTAVRFRSTHWLAEQNIRSLRLVIAGLVPAIHVPRPGSREAVGHRDEPGDDD